LAIAVSLLGVRPNFFIKNSITKSVTVLNPRQITVQTTMRNPTNGDMMEENPKIPNIFTIDLKRLNTKLGNGAALMKNP